MNILRTQFSNGVVAEFLPPRRASNKVVVLCKGLPSSPQQNRLMYFLSKKNFWVFHVRYRGTWESSGKFLDQEPQLDVFGVIDELSTGFKSVWEGIEYRVQPDTIYVMGSSFGGATALMSSLSKKVDKVVALSPVVDWAVRSDVEPQEYLLDVLCKGYPGAYRFDSKDWNKLGTTNFFNPVSHIPEFDANKIMIIHAYDDDVVKYSPVEQFAQQVGCTFVPLRTGGHLSSSLIMRWKVWRKIIRFLT